MLTKPETPATEALTVVSSGKSPRNIRLWAGHVPILLIGLAATVVALAQTGPGPFNAPLPNMRSEPPSEASSYETRITKRQMVHDMDPNVYAYTTAFAKRFQMPEQWITPDLEGAAAVAFRVMPYYRSCGWGSNPTACREDETICVLDVYFDQDTQALPWDPRMRVTEFDRDLTSAKFIPSFANPMARPKADDSPLARSPFTDPQTGKELFWNGGYRHSDVEYGGSFVGIRAYDREIFKGMSLLVLGTACDVSAIPQRLWLGSEGVHFAQSRDLALRLVYLPIGWQLRVKELLTTYSQRNRAYFKQVFEEMNKAEPSTTGPANK